MLGDRRCDCLLFLYLLATKNIAAPYTAAPHATPTPIPTDEARTGFELPIPPPTGAPPSFMVAVDEGEAPDTLEPPSVRLSAAMGSEMLIIDSRVLVLLSGVR